MLEATFGYITQFAKILPKLTMKIIKLRVVGEGNHWLSKVVK
jgi:hypothetical protein